MYLCGLKKNEPTSLQPILNLTKKREKYIFFRFFVLN
jgi:hypothetical protein